MLGARTFPGNPFDGHILSAALEQTENLTQDLSVIIKQVVADLGLGVKEPSLPVRSSRISAMQISTGTVVDGRVVVQGTVLPEGATVTLLTRGKNEGFLLAPEEEDELLKALAEIDSGEHMSLEQLLETLPRNN